MWEVIKYYWDRLWIFDKAVLNKKQYYKNLFNSFRYSLKIEWINLREQYLKK